MSADFIDSNVLIYLIDESDARKTAIAGSVVSQAIESRSASISHQVVQETLNMLVSKSTVPATAVHAQQFFEDVLLPLWDIVPTAETYRRAVEIRFRYRFNFYDALIVSSAVGAGSTRLLTEDLQHGQRIGSLVIENPFR
jgi:predicted nucleic acid-binding protein